MNAVDRRKLVRRCADCDRPHLCAVIKDHTGPCGLNESVAVAEREENGWARALRHDRVSGIGFRDAAARHDMQAMLRGLWWASVQPFVWKSIPSFDEPAREATPEEIRHIELCAHIGWVP